MRFAEIMEATPPRPIEHQTYWHGTDNRSGHKIAQEGLAVGVERPRGAAYLPPVLPGIYMTPVVTYALRFATENKKQKYGWLFAARGIDLINIEIDEDEVGRAVQRALKIEAMPGMAASPTGSYDDKFDRAMSLTHRDKGFRDALLAAAKQTLSQDEIAALMTWDTHYGRYSRAGAKLIPVLLPEVKLKMIEYGCHIAHLDHLKPHAGWRLDPRKGSQSTTCWWFLEQTLMRSWIPPLSASYSCLVQPLTDVNFEHGYGSAK